MGNGDEFDDGAGGGRKRRCTCCQLCCLAVTLLVLGGAATAVAMLVIRSRRPVVNGERRLFENEDKAANKDLAPMVGANKDILSEQVERENRFYGMSYSPFGLGDNRLCPPYDDTGFQCMLSDQVKSDVRLISTMTNRIKTYSLICEVATDAVLTYAEENGMEVVLGIWFNKDEKDNENEFERLERVLQKHADSGVITDIMLGNEAVFIVEVGVEALAAALRRLRDVLAKYKAAKVRIGTAEIFNVWMGEAADKVAGGKDLGAIDMRPVIDQIDWLGLNTHPYYGGIDPKSGDSGKFVRDEWVALKEKWGKPVYVTETGYPTRGDKRKTSAGTATPGVSGQTKFMAQIEAQSRKEKMPVFYFEPFDGDWKRRWLPFNELDYSWGVFKCDRSQKDITLPPPGAF